MGVARRPDQSDYQAFRTYDIVDSGKWPVRAGRYSVRFVHELNDGKGYAYRYTKSCGLWKITEMVIEHQLENTGSKTIRTMQYNHNFFVIDGEPTGPAALVKFSFEPRAKRAGAGRVGGDSRP